MSKRILVVEDQEDNRRIVRDLLTANGYTLIEAADGNQGLAAAQREKPDLILMDIQLPKVSGYDAVKAIRSKPGFERVPIIAVTSYALSGDDQKAYECGCSDYITKPFHPRMLLEKVEKYLTSA